MVDLESAMRIATDKWEAHRQSWYPGRTDEARDALVQYGFSMAKAIEIALDASRGDQFALSVLGTAERNEK